MPVNIYSAHMEKAYLFGTLVLHSGLPIPREDVPQGWFCYDLCGIDRAPSSPYILVDQTDKYHTGSVLSRQPLKNDSVQRRLGEDDFRLTGKFVSLKVFCEDEKITAPEVPFRYLLRPASPEDAGLFYAQTPERDEELGAIGHVRIDFGRGGKEFYHSWWPRGPEALNTQEFKDELGKVVNDLRKGILKDLSSMRRCCHGSDGAIGGRSYCQNYGFTLETERYLYRLRCNPAEGDYQAYLSCFVRQEQELGLTEQGRQRLRNAANPNILHYYNWYVMEACNTAEEQFTSGLSLENAIQRYTASENESKRLGVTKDGIAAVDLVIRHDGREWVSEDWTKSEIFAKDPTVADAAAKMRQLLEDQTPNQSMAMGGLV